MTVVDPIRTPVLTARGLSKSFPGVVALDGVDLDLFPGEVNALVGENGAGKSTLIKIMSGLYRPDSGELRVGGEPVPAAPAAAHAAGIATIHQDHNLVPNMSVAENILLGHWPARHGFVSKATQIERASRALAMVAPHIRPGTLARRLSPAEGQLVEIARALSENSRVLIMDEPTTSLSGPEIERLFGIVRELKSRGMAIVFVSHWLEEVFAIADRVTVLRDGHMIGTRPASDLTEADVIRMMVGRDVEALDVPPRPVGDVVLDVQGITRAGVLDNVSFSVRAGEIVTLAGLVGAGRSEVVNAIFGVDPRDSGTVTVNGKPVRPNNPIAAIEAGIGYVPEDRRGQGLVGQLSVAENLTLASFHEISSGGFVRGARVRTIVERARSAMRIRMASPEVPVSTLSGGNQQKVVIGRWLARAPRVLILDEPTKGVDVGAKAEIGDIIVGLAKQGVAILLVSSEMPEVIGFSDRILVMRAGRIVREVDRASKSPETVMQYATMGQGAAL
ncbi:MAG: sugar ABC transporter ATP-binding protein [Rubellimicrobium sp.]|nr:sugar ABC transporter ATP-binding protein [Rubellimicrobium sp.]